MTTTPWGEADQLRSRMLHPGPGAPKEVVARSQRERLFAAMVATVADKGYEAATVADLLELSGVSRSAFYEHFKDKDECFVAAVDEILRGVLAVVTEAYGSEAEWDVRLRATLAAFLQLVADQPAAARMCFLEAYAAGPAAVDRMEAAAQGFEKLIREAFEQSPERAGMPREVVRGIVGGLRKVIQTRLRRGEEAQLPALAPELFLWAMSYRTPAAPLRKPRSAPAAGTPRSVVDDPAERILEATARTVAAKGYAATTVADIAREGRMSLSTFYAHFPGKEEAVIAAFESAQAQAIAAAVPAARRAADWPHSVRAGIHALLAYMSVETAWAQLGAVEVYAAGSRALADQDEAIDAFHSALAQGFEHADSANAVAGEAVGGAISALLFDQIRRRGAERARDVGAAATFLALAPFIGPDAASVIANERPRSASRTIRAAS